MKRPAVLILLAVVAFALYEFFRGQSTSVSSAPTVIAPPYSPATALAGYSFAQTQSVPYSTPNRPTSPSFAVPPYQVNPRVAAPQSQPPQSYALGGQS